MPELEELEHAVEREGPEDDLGDSDEINKRLRTFHTVKYSGLSLRSLVVSWKRSGVYSTVEDVVWIGNESDWGKSGDFEGG